MHVLRSRGQLIGRTIGKAMGEFRKATDDLKSTIEREVRLEELKKIAPTAAEFTTPFDAVSRTEPSVIATSVDESSVDEPTSLPVAEEQNHPDLSSVDPLDDSTTRRLDDPSERA